MMEEQNLNNTPETNYGDANIITLTGVEHIRLRPGMYIGRLGDGSHAEDGIYVLLKEIIDNSIDEFKMNAGKRIEVEVVENRAVTVRDYGRGIPQGKMIEAVSILNTGGKYDSKAFQKSIGLNGVGTKAVNALSNRFEVRSYRDGVVRTAVFEKGKLVDDQTEKTSEENGTFISFTPDDTLFLNYKFQDEFVSNMLRNYTYLNTGLEIYYNGSRIVSRNGLKDLLKDTMDATPLYEIIHLKGDDIEIAFTHTNQQYGEEYHSFVNGQHTIQGGTHQSAFKEHIARTIKEFYGKNYEYSDIRSGIIAAIAINVQEPQFESQTKIKLGSLTMEPNGGISVNKFVGDFVKTEVDNYLHKNLDVAEIIEEKIKDNERDRKAIAGVTKLARERAKKANLHNRKLRDCKIHLNDPKGELKEDPRVQILGDVLGTQNMLFRTDFLKSIGAWNIACRTWDDWELGLRVMLHQPKILWFKEKAFHEIITHENSVMGDNFSQNYKQLIRTLTAAINDLQSSILQPLSHYHAQHLACLYPHLNLLMYPLYLRTCILLGHMQNEKMTGKCLEFKMASKALTIFRNDNFTPTFSQKVVGNSLRIYTMLGGKNAWKIALKISQDKSSRRP